MDIHLFTDDIIMNAGVFLFLVLFFFLLFMFITFIISLFIRSTRQHSFTPDVAVIVPAYNEEDNILTCLESIAACDYDKEKLDVLVVDDRSTDTTRKLVEDFAKEHGFVRIITGKHQGKAKSLNLGLKRTEAEIIVTIDADSVLDKGFLKEIVRPLNAPNVGASNGNGFIARPGSVIQTFQYIEYNLNNLVRLSFSKVFRNGIWFFGAAAAFKRSVLSSIGNFKSSTLTEDMDVALEIFRTGLKIETVSDATYTTRPCTSWKELLSQRMRWYYGSLQALFKNRDLIKLKGSSPSIWFLFFNQFWWTAYSIVFIPLITYQVWYWMPSATGEVYAYLFRWFTFAGPVYVLYMIPVWGVNLLNIFGVLSGIISMATLVGGLVMFRKSLGLKVLVALFFYFPYTLFINFTIVASVFRYAFSKKKFFIG